MGLANPNDPFTNVWTRRGHIAKLFPVLKPAACDHVIHRRQRPVGMIQMPMHHTVDYTFPPGP